MFYRDMRSFLVFYVTIQRPFEIEKSNMTTEVVHVCGWGGGGGGYLHLILGEPHALPEMY
jgi:hypothetical protein